MNLPYAQGHFKVLMSKACGWGGGLCLQKHLSSSGFNTMMIIQSIKTTCQILPLTLKLCSV